MTERTQTDTLIVGALALLLLIVGCLIKDRVDDRRLALVTAEWSCTRFHIADAIRSVQNGDAIVPVTTRFTVCDNYARR